MSSERRAELTPHRTMHRLVWIAWPAALAAWTLAEPRQQGDVDRGARSRFDTPIRPDPARGDAGARGSRSWLPTTWSRHRVSNRAERGLPVRQVAAAEHSGSPSRVSRAAALTPIA